jgi:Hemerythrin HHE cation binding domain
MIKMGVYRIQHQKLMAMFANLQMLLGGSITAEKAAQIRSLLSKIASALIVHLYVEDTELNPQLVAHGDPHVQAKAKAYQDEMGDLVVTFKGYLAKYSSADKIQGASIAFIGDTDQIIQAVAMRIKAEDTDLFPMLEGLR